MKKELKDGYTVVYRIGVSRTVIGGELLFRGDELLFRGEKRISLNRYDDQLKAKEYLTNNDIVSICDVKDVEIWKRVNEKWVDLRVPETRESIEYTITFKNEKTLKISNDVATILHKRIVDGCNDFQCFTDNVKETILIINISEIVCIE
jgi:hypothetical protein